MPGDGVALILGARTSAVVDGDGGWGWPRLGAVLLGLRAGCGYRAGWLANAEMRALGCERRRRGQR